VTRPVEATAPTAQARDLASVRVLLRALLPLPCLDLSAAVALLRYQRRHKLAAYWSQRTRRLQRLEDLRPPNLSL